jgi:hypothetical protein
MKKLIIKAPTWSQLSFFFFFFCLECEATLDDNGYYFQLAMKLSMVDIICLSHYNTVEANRFQNKRL